MGLYEGIKDVAKVLQKADNIELYQKLIELSSQALDMQAKITELTTENAGLKHRQEIADNIQFDKKGFFITLKNDPDKIKYCIHCWDTEKQLIHLRENEFNGSWRCPKCGNKGVYDEEKYNNQIIKVIKPNNPNMW